MIAAVASVVSDESQQMLMAWRFQLKIESRTFPPLRHATHCSDCLGLNLSTLSCIAAQLAQARCPELENSSV